MGSFFCMSKKVCKEFENSGTGDAPTWSERLGKSYQLTAN
jgi:hypothetical protein